MKSTLSVAAAILIALSLSACSTSPVQMQIEQQKEQTARQEKQTAMAVDNAPKWMSILPKTPNTIYASGSATSIDFSMADLKANTIAYSKICMSAGGKVRAQTKMFRSDNGDASVEQSEIAIRSICPDVDISGVETVEIKHVSEGNRIRTYVLIALPYGSSNVIKSTRDAQERAPAAFKELDAVVAPVKTPLAQPARGVDTVDIQ